MSQTLRLINLCDHSYPVPVSERRIYQITKSGTDYDKVTDLKIGDVNHITFGEYCYYPDIHFEIFAVNKIKWICHPVYRPIAGSVFEIEFDEVNAQTQTVEPENCERCGGNGWFASFLSEEDASINLIDGSEKLVQDFIKILLTDSRKHLPGTILKSIPSTSAPSSSEVLSKIEMAVMEAEESLKVIQRDMINIGTPLTQDEILSHVVVEDIDAGSGFGDFYLKVSLVSLGKSMYTVGLNL